MGGINEICYKNKSKINTTMNNNYVATSLPSDTYIYLYSNRVKIILGVFIGIKSNNTQQKKVKQNKMPHFKNASERKKIKF